MKSQRGFTLLEVLVASLIMGIAVAGILSGLAAASRNAARLTGYDRATLLARQKMDELLVDDSVKRGTALEATFDPSLSGGVPAGWRATIATFETVPGQGSGGWAVERVQLEVWWMDGATRHSFNLEGYRRGIGRVPGA
jgi:general secretion pathway protein I